MSPGGLCPHIEASLPSRLLDGDAHGAPGPAPVRIVHLGLSAYDHSHQPFYTNDAGNAASQDRLFTLVQRSGDGEVFELVGSAAEALDGPDLQRLKELVASPQTAVVTLTITEAAYAIDESTGRLESSTPLGRLVLALAARRSAGAGPLAVVCCDNLAHNGAATRNAVLALAAWPANQAGSFAGLRDWIRQNVSFISTSVDGITPRAATAHQQLFADACDCRGTGAIVTKPLHNWILSGDFPAGRPRWEDAGAVFVDDIEPYENRRLWLLNGAYSILAYSGLFRGHQTVADALSDSVCRDAVDEFWDEAARHLPDNLGIPEYRAALLKRFGNSRIPDHLTQIAKDGTTKLRMRALPVLMAERAAGHSGDGAARMIAAWLAYLSSAVRLQDPIAADITNANALKGSERTAALLALLAPDLAGDASLVTRLDALQTAFAAASPDEMSVHDIRAH